MGFEVDPDGENYPGKYAPRYAFGVNPGIGFAMSKGHPFLKEMMDLYSRLDFGGAVMTPWLKTVVAYTTEALMAKGLKGIKDVQIVNDITIYPQEFFAPINVISGRLHITSKTRSIHRYMGSWDVRRNGSLKERMKKMLPEWVFLLLNRIKRQKYKVR